MSCNVRLVQGRRVQHDLDVAHALPDDLTLRDRADVIGERRALDIEPAGIFPRSPQRPHECFAEMASAARDENVESRAIAHLCEPLLQWKGPNVAGSSSSLDPFHHIVPDSETNSVNETPASALRARALIDKLDLEPHPEGGSYRELHRSSARVQTARGDRAAITAIYYLLERNQIARWHVVESDEIWHFYEGSPLELLAYDPEARVLVRHVLGDTREDHQRVAVIRPGFWQAARSLGDFSLVGCSVGPGFDFQDFRFVASLSRHGAHFEGELAPFSSLL